MALLKLLLIPKSNITNCLCFDEESYLSVYHRRSMVPPTCTSILFEQNANGLMGTGWFPAVHTNFLVRSLKYIFECKKTQ